MNQRAREEVDPDARFLVQRQGLDYGPYSKKEVIERFRDGTFGPDDTVFDKVRQVEQPAHQFELFREPIEAYRQARQRELEQQRQREARRERIKNRVMTGLGWTVALGVGGGLVVMAVLYMLQPEPEPVRLKDAIVSLDYDFVAAPGAFRQIEVDKALMNRVFREEDPEAPDSASGGTRGSGSPKRRAGQKRGGKRDVDFSGDRKAPKKGLRDGEVQRRVMGRWKALRRCVTRERRRNSQFAGLTVEFYIRPDGGTTDIGVVEDSVSSAGRRCIRDQFKKLEFNETGVIGNVKVTYPLYQPN